VFVLYLLTATWALILHHLVTESAGPAGRPLTGAASGPSPGLTWPFILSTNTIAFLSLSCTLLLFVLIPRFGLGYFHRSQSNLIRMSGFSEQVDLGAIGSVKQDRTIVMRIQPSRPLPAFEGIYWRGMVFDHYDGRTWRNSFGSGRLLSSEGSGVFNLAYRRHPERTITQEVILEALDTAVLFGAPNIIQIGGRFSQIRVNGMNSVSLPTIPATRIDYTLSSMLPIMTQSDFQAESISYPLSTFRHFIQLPDGSKRIQQLAIEILDQNPSARTVLQKVITIERYLRKNYQYTLDVQPVVNGSPIDDFLFRQKAGFCEHYATAMTLLLRSIDIPARFVTGFLPGEWNEFGKYYTVRQSNAHAWVEVWFPQSGWIPFDPTPPAPPDDSIGLIGLLSRTMDSFQWRWNRYIIYYGIRDQIRLAAEVKSDTLRIQSVLTGLVKGWLRTGADFFASMPVRPATLGAIVVLAGVGLYGIIQWIRRARGPFFLRWPRRSQKAQTVAFYIQMLDLFHAKGVPKPDTLTPREFIRKIPPPLSPLRPAAAELTGYYYRVRFAGISLTEQEERRVFELLDLLKTPLSVP
jgi:protein-glutamine gamma-glutamyltransferase